MAEQFGAVTTTHYCKRRVIYQGAIEVATIRIWLRHASTDPRDEPEVPGWRRGPGVR